MLFKPLTIVHVGTTGMRVRIVVIIGAIDRSNPQSIGGEGMKVSEHYNEISGSSSIKFFMVMQEKLAEKSYKGGWVRCTLGYLRRRLHQEVKELIACSQVVYYYRI